jgi:hypothetical protein
MGWNREEVEGLREVVREVERRLALVLFRAAMRGNSEVRWTQ